ncbi:MAG: BatA and WFA domain-containing protein [Candidatus Hydrogenedentes bacterium]|nr:BatA and WFA domain-containing protein [Candidatus Hydrogenedentota bacterium]
MGLLMPLLMGGAALAVLPWIIHRIRRPTHQPTPFSSLMFVPETPPPVRERKRIEHPWLMLLRMLILIALALAYARPYQLVPAAAEGEGPADREHVILVDASMSAGADFDAIRSAALAALDEVNGAERVAVVAFDTAPRLIVPLAGPGAARGALESLAPSEGATRFVPALRFAEQLLEPEAAVAEEEAAQRIIHLVSDLQRSGLPEGEAGYTLARGVQLRAVPVAVPVGNQAVEAVALEPRPPNSLHLRARVRNHGLEHADGMLQVWIGEQLAAENPVSIPPGGVAAVALAAEADLAMSHEGEVRLRVADAVAADNAHYFVFHPEPARIVGMLASGTDARFLEAAIAESQPVPWRLSPLTPDAVSTEAQTGALPEVIIVAGLETAPDGLAEALQSYVTSGGRILLIPGPGGLAAPLSDALLSPAGVAAGAPRYDQADPRRFSSMNWIDFDHPVFQAFRSAAYSDFSMVRFHNYHRLDAPADLRGAVIARLDDGVAGDGDPALVAFEVGAGRAVVWAFPLDPAWTNLTRTRRFVPLIHESIALLLPALPPRRDHRAGLPLTPPPELAGQADALRMRWPGAADPVAWAADTARAPRAGFVRWLPGDDAAIPVVEPVNTDPAESDLRPFTVEEFLLRAGAVTADLESAPAEAPETVGNVVHWEYAYSVLVILAAALFLETGLVLWHRRRGIREQRVT